MTKSAKTVPAMDLLLPSIKLIKDNIGVFFVLIALPILLTTQTGTPPELAPEASMREVFDALTDIITPIVMVGSLMSFLFYPFLTYALRQSAKTGSVTFAEAFEGGRSVYFSLLGVLMLTSLAVVLGMMLFIIPGVIALRSFVLAPYYLIDSKGKLGILQAMKKSATASKPYKWSIYSVIGLVLLFGLLSSFGPIGQIAGTLLGLLYTPAFALRYQEIAR